MQKMQLLETIGGALARPAPIAATGLAVNSSNVNDFAVTEPNFRDLQPNLSGVLHILTLSSAQGHLIILLTSSRPFIEINVKIRDCENAY